MATFNVNNQQVKNQYNADTINIAHAQSKDELLVELKQVQNALNNAINSNLITGDKAVDAETFVKKAVLQIEQEVPNKKTLLAHLNSAKELVTSVDKLSLAFISIIGTVSALF